jgi:uncharacterized Ntn-hydrolase superfamily protein
MRPIIAHARQDSPVTYSIVARCPHTEMLGIGIASHVLAVGRVAVSIEPGLGAVATQSLVLMAHGSRTLAGMRAGLTPGEALAQSLGLDSTPQVRQVGAVSLDGSVAAHTGEGCIPHAGDVQGDGYSAQANMMANAGVPEAMAEAFEATAGQGLAARILAALDAAEAVGGDIRGRQSAALVVTGPELTGDPLVDRIVDVRVDDSPVPLPELRRLTHLALANQRLDVADGLMGAGDVAGAAEAYREATEMAPDYLEFAFWQAAALADSGDPDEARRAWAAISESRDAARWGELLRRTVSVGLLGDRATSVLLDEPPS